MNPYCPFTLSSFTTLARGCKNSPNQLDEGINKGSGKGILEAQMRKLTEGSQLRSPEIERKSNVLSQTWICLINIDKVECANIASLFKTSRLTSPVLTLG